MLFAIKNRVIPVLTVLSAIGFLWYGFTIFLNSPWQIQSYEKSSIEWSYFDLAKDTRAHERPVLPAPHQILSEIWQTTVKKKITSKRSLIFHSWVTLSSTLLGFFMGTLIEKNKKKFSIKEIPITFYDREKGISKIPKLEIFRTLKNLLMYMVKK